MSADEIISKLFSNKYSRASRVNLISQADDPLILLETLFIYFDIALYFSNDSAILNIMECLDIFKRVFSSNACYCRILFKKAEYFSNINDNRKSLSLYKAALKSSLQCDDLFYTAQSYSKLGKLFKNLSSSPPILKKFEKEFRKYPDFKTGMLAKSFEYFDLSQKIFDDLGHEYNSAVSLFNSSILLYYAGNVEKSYYKAVLARELCERLKSSSLLGEIFLHMANIHCDKKEYYMAKIYYRAAADFFALDRNYIKSSDVIHKIAWILSIENNFASSLPLYRKALDIKISLDYRQALGDFYLNRGIITLGLGSKAADIEKYFERAAFIFKSLKMEDKALISKFYVYKVRRIKGYSESLYNFMSSYKPRSFKDIISASAGISYQTRKRESDFSAEAYGSPGKTFCVPRKSLAGVMSNLSVICGISGDKYNSKFFSAQSKTVGESI